MKHQVKIAIVIFISIVIFLSLVLSFCIDSESQEKIKFSLDLISAISTIITLFIALILFNKFGVDKSIVDKKFVVVVVELLTEIKICS